MPLDTSIPLQVALPQFEFPNAASAADRQYNALRAQALQQEMMRNQLIMQNTMEDRARAEQNRQVAAAQAAEAKRRQQELIGIYGQFGASPAAVGQRGAGYSGTGMSTSAYEPIRNQLVQRGFLPQATDIAELENKTLTGAKTQAEMPGVQAESRKKATEADTAEYDAAVARLVPLVRTVKTGQDAASFTNAMYDDPVLGPKLERIIPRAQAVARAPAEYAADPLAWMKNHMLTGKELADAMTAVQKTTTPKPETLPPGAVSVDMNPQSPTYGQVIARGGPTEQQRKVEQQTKQLKGNINSAITNLEEMSKEGGLLDKATASGAGAAVDYGASVLGYATPGSIATGELQVLQDPILKMIPRFEGPQSDKDTLTYQQAAGQLANPNIPAAVRKAAAKTLIKLFKERQGQFAMPDLPDAQTGAPSEFEGFSIKEK